MNANIKFRDGDFTRTMYALVRCAGCGRGGLAIIHSHAQDSLMVMEHYYPASVDIARIPAVVLDELFKELREAELCAAYGAWRASSAMLRSVLEKTLKLNGFTRGQFEE